MRGDNAEGIRMRIARGIAVLWLILLGTASSAGAQASPYVPLDDPMLPAFEHLIARGEIRDPSPMVRPFRRSDARRVLTDADTTQPLVHELLRWYREPELVPEIGTEADTSDAARVQGVIRIGTQAATQARRDLLHPAGDGGVWPVADIRLEATWGPVALVARPGIENRLKQDPDWIGRRDNLAIGRLIEGYASVQAGPVRFVVGQQERNWGPVGLPGFPISNVTYRRDGWAMDFALSRLHFSAYASQLSDQRDSTGALVKRYFITKRLGWRPTDRLQIAAWESTVLQGQDRNFEAWYANPFAFIYAIGTYGYGDPGINNMIGADITWRAAGAHTVHAQFALDDFWYQQRERNRDRFGGTLMLTGPVGSTAAYRATYSRVSAFALRAFIPLENFTDAGVGVGRNFSDNDQATLQVSVPVTTRWLVTPEFTLFRQGEGRINAPYPPLPLDPVTNPTIFIGTVERTLRAAVAVSGRQGPLQLTANVGLHRVTNAGNRPGVSLTRTEARVQGMLAIGRAGWLW